MPPQARIDAPGGVHHMIYRGTVCRKIFLDDQDRNNWIERLGTILVETSMPYFSWALMFNHVHLLLQTGRGLLSTVMRWLLSGYAVSFTRRYRRHGQLFQNRYKSILC
jgi:putative transposase